MIPQKSHFLKELKRKSKAQATPKFSDLLPDPGLDLPPVALPLFSLYFPSVLVHYFLLKNSFAHHHFLRTWKRANRIFRKTIFKTEIFHMKSTEKEGDEKLF